MHGLRCGFAVILIGLAGVAMADDAPKLIPSCLGIAGRYQIIISTLAARDTFLLDTCEGRVWQMTKFSSLVDEPTAWDLVPRIDSIGDYHKFLYDHRAK